MEEQAIEKDREFRAGKEPLIREINKMHHELQDERLERTRMIQKKNSEIAYFKAELETLMKEMQLMVSGGAGVSRKPGVRA